MRHTIDGALRVFAFPGGQQAIERSETDERGLRGGAGTNGHTDSRIPRQATDGVSNDEMQSACSRKDPARGDEESLAWCNSRVDYSS